MRLTALFPLARYAVEGDSMAPAFRAGERLLMYRWAYRGHLPRAGDVVLLEDPEREGHVLLKRVAFDPDPATRAVYVLGDDSGASRDSRHFGEVPASSIIGKVWRKY
jgi:nickel-type superoxide dismutase maturation protease